jgi:lysophospholipase L1-like esterase
MVERRYAAVFAAGAVTGLGLHNAAVLLANRRRSVAMSRLLEHDGLLVAASRGASPRPIKLAMTGDSGIAGNGLSDPDEALPRRTAQTLANAVGRPVELLVRAQSGLRTRQIHEQLVPEVIAARPDAVIVSAGVNDVIGRVPPARLRADTVALATDLRTALPDAVLIWCLIPDMRHAPAVPLPASRLLSFLSIQGGHAQREALAAAAPEVIMVSLPQPTAQLYGPDGFHPGPRAVAMVAAALAAELADALVGAEQAA